MNTEELKNACAVLGLNANDFLEEPELHKSVEDIDYKALYEQQKSLNIEIVKGIGNIPSIIEKGVTDKFNEILGGKIDTALFKEIKKSVDGIKEDIESLKNSPMHEKKSFTKIQAVEKSLGQNSDVKCTYSLSDFSQVKKLKQYLGNKTMEALEKGISNSVYERASMQLDANRIISPELIAKLYESDKIMISQ